MPGLIATVPRGIPPRADADMQPRAGTGTRRRSYRPRRPEIEKGTHEPSRGPLTGGPVVRPHQVASGMPEGCRSQSGAGTDVPARSKENQ